MFCTFCGNPIDRKTMKCVSCGKPVGSLSGGNSIKHLLQGEMKAVSQPETPIEKTDPQLSLLVAEMRELKDEVKKNKINLFTIISGFCALLCLICVVSIFALGGKTKRLAKELNVSVDAQFSVVTQKLGDIEAALDAKNTTSDVSTIQVLATFSIDKNPESVMSVTPGRTNVAFICKASGDELLFSWIKYSADRNVWELIESSDTRFEVKSTGNESRLIIVNANAEHVGTYICVIEEKNGDVHYSSPAQLLLASSYTGSYDDPNSESKNDASA